MRTSVLLRFFVPLVLFAGFGVFWADAVWWHKDSGVRAWTESIPVLDHALQYLHFPAMALFVLSGYLRLGPSGEAGWVMLPICMVVQWTITGLLVGVWLSRRHARQKDIANVSGN